MAAQDCDCNNNCCKKDTDIDWAKENKMLADLRWKMRGQPIKNEWWSI